MSFRYIGAFNDKLAKEEIFSNGPANHYNRILTGKLRRYKGFKGLAKLRLWKSYLFNIRDIFGLIIGTVQAFVVLVIHRPRLIFSKGGYPALPVCVAGIVLRIPIVTHDSDSVSGLTHRLIGKYAKKRLFGVKPKGTLPYHWRHVGVPINPEFNQPLTSSQKAAIRKEYSLLQKKMILVTGGGLGSRNLNSGALEAIASIPTDYDVVIVTGSKFYKASVEQLQSLKPDDRDRVHLLEFTRDMVNLMRLADIVITRAGATALAEVSASAKPTIIAPNHLLPGSHQTHNTRAYQDADAALIISDSSNGRKLNVKELIDAINAITGDPQLRKSLSQNIRSFATPNSTDLSVSELEELL